jgi:hypothetical protein
MRTFTSLLLLPPNTVYQFRTLPFGNSTAPLVFTRVFQTVIAHLHTLSVQIHSYLDDSLIRDFDQQTCFPSRNGNSAFSKSGVFDILEEVGFYGNTTEQTWVSFFHQRKNLYPSVREFRCSNTLSS